MALTAAPTGSPTSTPPAVAVRAARDPPQTAVRGGPPSPSSMLNSSGWGRIQVDADAQADEAPRAQRDAARRAPCGTRAGQAGAEAGDARFSWREVTDEVALERRGV